MAGLELISLRWPHRAEDLRSIRSRVFMLEQGVSPADEWDERDEDALHVLAEIDGAVVGCARLLTSGKLTRMAVLREYRGQGVGRALLHFTLHEARDLGLASVYLDAQLQALPFYERYGFIPRGEEFLDAGILHRAMAISL